MRQMVGGCLCGKVRYSAETEPIAIAICHWKNCQKQAGTAFTVVIGMSSSALSIQGPLKTFNDMGESGKPASRRFCPDCGSPNITEVDAMPGLIFLKAGTLDDTSWVHPGMQMWCNSAQPWVSGAWDMPSFSKMPSYTDGLVE